VAASADIEVKRRVADSGRFSRHIILVGIFQIDPIF